MAKRKTKKKAKKRAKLFSGSALVGESHPRGMVIKPTREGRREAKEALEDAAAGGRSTYDAMYDLMEDWIGNGWTWIPPEEIGALTDAPIISPDATIEDDGSYTIYPGGAVYWHSNYMVEDPVEKWARGEGVVWDVSKAKNPHRAQIAKEWAATRSPAAIKKEHARLQREAPLPDWRSKGKKRGKKSKKRGKKNPVSVRKLVNQAMK